MRQVLRQRLRSAFAFPSVSAAVSALVTLFLFGFQAVPLMNGFVIGFFASFFIMALNATALDRAALERRAFLFMDLRAKDTSYLSRYGLVPRFRTGCHLAPLSPDNSAS